MSQLQKKIEIKDSSSRKVSLTCLDILREVPGKRTVFNALLDDKPVILKIFTHPINAQKNQKLEIQGYKKLKRKKVNCPHVIFHGKTQQGGLAVVTEKIADAPSALDILKTFDTQQQKVAFLKKIASHIAEYNHKGISQQDLHLENFLIKQDDIFLIDPAQIKFYDQQLDKPKSIEQLAVIACTVIDDKDAMIDIAQEYFSKRGWEFNKENKKIVLKAVSGHRNYQVKRGLKKCLRTSKRVIAVKAHYFNAVFNKEFLASAKPRAFVNKLDQMIENGQYLKKGNTCTVAVSEFNNTPIVIKRYNNKGLLHCLAHSLLSSRAKKSWLNAHKLIFSHIKTPNPLAYIEIKKGPLVLLSYIVTEFVDGPLLCNFLHDKNVTDQQKQQVNKNMDTLFAKLHSNRIVHGDMKHSNIIIEQGTPVLTDLDSMKIHKLDFIYDIERKKEIAHYKESAKRKPPKDN